MAEIEVVDYLASKGHHGKQGTSGEWRYPCFFDCSEPPDSKKRKLYVNARSGKYHCKVCHAAGGTTLLQRHFGDAAGSDDDDDGLPTAKHQVLEQAVDVGQAMLEHNDEILLYLLNERGFTPETIVERRLGYVGKPWSLVDNLHASQDAISGAGLSYSDGPRKGQDFFYDHLLIPYIEQGRVRQLRGKTMGGNHKGRYMTGPGQRVRAYNVDSARDADQVICVEGEGDCILLSQTLAGSPQQRVRDYGVVGLPGANAIPKELEHALKDVRRVFIAFDPDDAGRAGAAKLKEQLGARARIVQLPEDGGDWTDLLTTGWTWREAVKALDGATGKRIFSMAEVHEAWVNARSRGDGLKTGFDQLDAILKPGIMPGQVLVLLSKTGTGKSITLCNIAVNLTGTPCLFISLEQTQEEIYERLQRIWRFYEPRASDQEVNEALSHVWICDANRLAERDITELITEYEIETGVRPEVVLIDYLGYFARGAGGRNEYEKVSNAVMALKAQAKQNKLAIIAPHQVNRVAEAGKPIDMSRARSSGVVEETGDFVLSIWRPDDAKIDVDGNAEPSGKLRLMVNKSRHGGKGRCLNLQMDLLTLSIVDDHTPEAKLASKHNYQYWRGVTYEELRKEQTKPVQNAMEV